MRQETTRVPDYTRAGGVPHPSNLPLEHGGVTGADDLSPVAQEVGFPCVLKVDAAEVTRRIRRTNLEAGGRLLEMSETEYMVRGVGYLGTLTDAELAEAAAKGIDL